MAKLKLLHNAKSGDESHSKEKLISFIQSKGFICDYSSVKEKDWEVISDDTDFIVIAGGDGTVKRVIKKMLDRKLIDTKFPLTIIPLGTANNLSKSLNIPDELEKAVAVWKYPAKKKFDIGRIYGLNKTKFFMEGMGYGIFPYLIYKMNKLKKPDNKNEENPERKLELSLQKLLEIVLTFKSQYAGIIIDGIDHSGDYLMVEILNIPAIGPNLKLAPIADPCDGVFEIVLIPESKREVLAAYVQSKINGREKPLEIKNIKGRNISITWNGWYGHIDDKLIKTTESKQVNIKIFEGLLEFYGKR